MSDELKIHSHPGKPKGLRPKSNKPSLKFRDHLRAAAIPTAPIVDPDLPTLQSITFYMDGNGPDPAFGSNDFPGAGDCVAAMTDHGLQVINMLLEGRAQPLSAQSIKTIYATQNPDFTWDTNPNTGSGSNADGGMDIQTLLSWLTTHGVNGHPADATHPPAILGFAEVDYTNVEEFDAAVYLGLALWTGVDLQDAQMQQFDEGKPWAVVSGSPDDGGHGIPYVYYNPPKTITWAQIIDTTEGFIQHRMNQCFFVITQAHVNHPAFRQGFDLESFAQAYTAITNRPFPVAVTPDPVVPPPTPDPSLSVTINITDPEIIKHLVRVAGSAGVDTWAAHHFQSYFRIRR